MRSDPVYFIKRMRLNQGVLRSANICISRWSKRSLREFSSLPNRGTDENQDNNSFESNDDFFKGISSDIGGTSPYSSSIFNKFDRLKMGRGPNFAGTSENQNNNNSSESVEDFYRRIYGGSSGTTPNSNDPLFNKIDKMRRDSERYINDPKFSFGKKSQFLDDLDDNTFDTLSDEMDDKLKKAATDFDIDVDEMEKEDFAFRPDVDFQPGNNYDTKDLDLTKPGVRMPAIRPEFEVTSEEVMKKADFRNVRFLANFLTAAGIIIKREQTKISAKAQRKVAREIKTARAFGLLPFTTMGTKRFTFGKTMEPCDEDYEYETYDAPKFVDADTNDDPIP